MTVPRPAAAGEQNLQSAGTVHHSLGSQPRCNRQQRGTVGGRGAACCDKSRFAAVKRRRCGPDRFPCLRHGFVCSPRTVHATHTPAHPPAHTPTPPTVPFTSPVTQLQKGATYRLARPDRNFFQPRKPASRRKKKPAKKQAPPARPLRRFWVMHHTALTEARVVARLLGIIAQYPFLWV